LNLLKTAEEEVQLQSEVLDQIEETLMKKIEVKKIVSQVGSQKRSRGRPPGSKNIKKKPIKILLQRKQTVQHSPVEEPNDQPGFADLPVEVKEEIVNDENATIEIGSNLVHFYLCRTLCL
jgi:hypothetical protein